MYILHKATRLNVTIGPIFLDYPRSPVRISTVVCVLLVSVDFLPFFFKLAHLFILCKRRRNIIS